MIDNDQILKLYLKIVNNDNNVHEENNAILEFYLNNIIYFFDLDIMKKELAYRGYIPHKSVNDMKHAMKRTLDNTFTENGSYEPDINLKLIEILQDIFDMSPYQKYIDFNKIDKIVYEYIKLVGNDQNLDLKQNEGEVETKGND